MEAHATLLTWDQILLSVCLSLYPSYCLNIDHITREAERSQVTIDSVSCFKWNSKCLLNPTANHFWQPWLSKATNRVISIRKTTEWVTESPGCSSYVTWWEERGGLWVPMFQTMSCSSLHTALPQTSPCLPWHAVRVGLDPTAGGVIRMLGKWQVVLLGEGEGAWREEW